MINTKETNFVSAVIYVHNSETVLQGFLKEIYTVLEKNFYKFEIICVNDASTDKSKSEIEQFAKMANNRTISIINMSMYHGLELSMKAGVDLAIGDYVYEFDLPYNGVNKKVIMDIYYKAMEGNDIVAVAPSNKGGGVNRLFYQVFNRYSLSDGDIGQEIFRILSRRAINRVDSISTMVVYRKAAYANSGLKREVVIDNSFDDKEVARSNNRSNIELAMDTLILFTNAIQRLAFCVSLLFLFLSIGIGCYTWISYFSIRKPVEGWTPIMLFLSMGFFGVFLILTIILQYLSVVLRIVFKKKQYLIESIIKITNN